MLNAAKNDIVINCITFLQGALSSIAEGYIITNFFWSLLSKIPAYLLIGLLGFLLICLNYVANSHVLILCI
jgi:hypothetical protein